MEDKTFEEFLREKYIIQEQFIDDVIPEGFDEWLNELEPEEWIRLGKKYATLIYVTNKVPF